MKKILLRVLYVTGLGVALLALTGGVYIANNMPSRPGLPEAPVLAMPAVSGEGRYEPYTGLHPRLMRRPEETFQFPILSGQIGPVEPLFAGHNQYPFLCGRDNSRDWLTDADVQPVPDNQDGIGIPVFALADGRRDSSQIVGFSKDCLFPTHVRYYYKRVNDDGFYPLEEADDDIEKLVIGGQEIDFVVRLETGTINRFLYGIAVLRGENETPDRPDGTYWNERLVYQMNGGVGVGRRQGNFSTRDILRDRFEQIRDGYAVVYSTANQTRNHYNIWLAEDTALRVKRQFISLYGEPLYTVGIGGSGGAIQQYLFAQNNPELLDAAIPLYSYPDMITQTIHVMDCELLEHFFEVTDADNPDWAVWENRSWLQGMAASSRADNRFAPLQVGVDVLNGRFANVRSNLKGSSECINGWRGLTPLVYNPHFAEFMTDFVPEVAQSVQWTHWDDLVQFYGQDERGYANTTWDNEGVQYGLDALKKGQISHKTFLKLNARIGSWRAPHEMKPENFWFLTGDIFPAELAIRSQHNMRLQPEPGQKAAPRTGGSVEAMQAAYRSGQVFVGVADIPIVDLRHYLDHRLDMHHSSASFSTRARMLSGQGHADNQVIWMTRRPHDPQVQAFELVDRWMLNIRKNPGAGVAANKPADAQDKCFARDGSLIAEGEGVWDGPWNGRETGACMQAYPAYRTSREVAGGGPEADVFKCRRISVADAVETGIYGEVDMREYLQDLKDIFPDGVCNYALGDEARPADLMEWPDA